MTELLTSAQMRAIEAAAIASGAVTGLELMERAGAGVVAAILAEWPEFAAGPDAGGCPPPTANWSSDQRRTIGGTGGYLCQDEMEKAAFRAVVLCGPGNNGGDGFVVARLLKERGWAVEVFLYGDAAKLPPDARVNCERWVAMGAVGKLSLCVTYEEIEHVIGAAILGSDPRCVIIDALFGTGLSRAVEGLGDLLQQVRDLQHEVDLTIRFVSVDVPAGLCSDSGRVLCEPDAAPGPWSVFAADLTVVFHKLKLGHVLAEGPSACGCIRLVDIGLPLSFSADRALAVGAPWAPKLQKAQAHKYGHGHAFILSGGVGRGGAARMAARGALRIGAGLVTVGCPPAAVIENASQLNAVMLRALPDGAALAAELEDARINALCLGPGLGVARAAEMLAVALGAVRAEHAPYGRRAIVIDADALTALAADAQLFALVHDRCVMTPHRGEFARLFPDIAAKLDAPATTGPAYSKVDATREAAARAGCVVLFKGADTVIADASGQCCINSAAYDRAAPWLATAGAGDVLAGFITGLLSRGFAPMQAAETAAWLHVDCARAFGPGLIAEDLPEALPGVFRALGI